MTKYAFLITGQKRAGKGILTTYIREKYNAKQYVLTRPLKYLVSFWMSAMGYGHFSMKQMNGIDYDRDQPIQVDNPNWDIYFRVSLVFSIIWTWMWTYEYCSTQSITLQILFYSVGIFLNWPPQPTINEKPMTVRRLLQYFGTDLLRYHLYNTIWIHMLRSRVNTERNAVVSDIRFPNEFKELSIFFSKQGYKVFTIRVMRDELKNSGTCVTPFPVQYVLENNGTVPELYAQLNECINQGGYILGR